MFCSNCAQKVVEGASFCHKCGSTVAPSFTASDSKFKEDTNAVASRRPGGSSSSAQTSTCNRLPSPSSLPSGSGPPIMTFREFRSVKEKDRQGHFKSKASKKRKTDDKTDSPSVKFVAIKVGMMTFRKDTDTLKPVRGSQLTVSVSPSSNSREVKAKAVEKQSRFNQAISKCPSVYYLLYPDLTRVENLPGTEEEFTLSRYKQELGKPYERITLYLCKITDHLANLGIFSTDSDSGDGLDDMVEDDIVEVPVGKIKIFI